MVIHVVYSYALNANRQIHFVWQLKMTAILKFLSSEQNPTVFGISEVLKNNYKTGSRESLPFISLYFETWSYSYGKYVFTAYFPDSFCALFYTVSMSILYEQNIRHVRVQNQFVFFFFQKGSFSCIVVLTSNREIIPFFSEFF